MDSTLPSLKIGAIIQVNMSPNDGDIAFASINDLGTKGELNLYVLKEYGYYEKDLPKKKDLINGITLLHKDGLKPIIFIVTVNEQDTSLNLRKNLSKAITKYQDRLIGKKIWIPLMGTGVGNLTIEESYKIIINVVNSFSSELLRETTLLLSIPNTEEGNSFHINITNYRLSQDIQKGKIQNFIQNFKYAFYLISNDDEKNKKEIENSYNDNNEFISLKNKNIENIKFRKNDILIIRSTHVGPNRFVYFNINALGIITDIYNDLIKVVWVIKNIDIPVRDLIYILDTTQIIDKDEVLKIFTKIIDNQNWNSFISIIKKLESTEKIAGLISDSEDGIDYLEIDKDVNAFAKVIAAKSFEPPLAIALFGKWGSGKSFFMNKLKTRITKLSEINNIYCKGVVQINFNAWSYMDSNLWASFVTRIFEELNSYIKKNTHTDEQRKLLEEELTSRLSITKDDIENLKNEEKNLSEQIENLKTKKTNLQKEITENIKKIKENTIWDFIKNANEQFNAKQVIVQSLKNNTTFIKSEEELKKIIPEKYWNDPKKTYELANSKYTFLKEFFRKEKAFPNILWLSLILIIIASIPFILDLCSLKISKISFLLPQTTLSILITLGAVWQRGEKVYKKLQPLVASFWKIKENHEEKINEAKANFEQEEKATQLKIEKTKSEIILISEHIQKAEILKTDLEFRINNALSTETLYSFIDKRSKSHDYQKHLGIISIIRKDFEILNNLFIGHNEEFNQTANVEEFKNKFTKPLERIILYIDDLDRCPEENVVQVLEAVNLLMAFPLFVVIVGVDSRWVKNALHKKHISQFNNLNEPIEALEVSNYLEKIFQIPFHLKDADDNNVKMMIKNLALNTFESPLKSVEESLISVVDNTSKSNKNLEEEINIDINVDDSTELNEIETTPKSISSYNNTITEINSNVEAENLILTDNEIQLLQDMSEIIGNNPRCIKRFVNTFRVIKAHEEFGYSDDSSNQEIIAILFLIALPLGKYKKLVPSFENFINKENNVFEKIKHYFKLDDSLVTLKNQLQDVLSSTNTTHETLLGMNTKLFKDHNKFIRRFTFSQI